MTIMITSKAGKMQPVLLAVSIISILAILFLKVSPAWDGSKMDNILYGWAWVIRGIPITGIMATIVLFNMGKRVPALLASLVFTVFSIITTVNIITYRDTIPWLIFVIDALAIVITVICLMTVLDRTGDYSGSYMIEQKEAILLSAFSVSIILAYYFMNLMVQNFIYYVPELGAINFFGTFTVETGESAILHAIIAIFIVAILFFAWKKQYKLVLGLDLALAFLLVILFFKNLDMPYRTTNFYILSLFMVVETVLAALIFKSSLKPDLSRKKAELELLKRNGKISEEKYQDELKKLNEGNGD
ncbi:MAG: hypothetical protein K6E42_00555 [Synergistes sp.]|nr:hypothetical protein [Synergistes sp.]